tara:strand:+ start:10002 stop:11084 length:1083 start_codon:yes stop_codon:yes gene_type:complete
MAITLTKEIDGHVLSNKTKYCYLYEPMRVKITDSSTSATKFYIDLEIYLASANSVQDSVEVQYGEYDVNNSAGVSVDLMKLAQQHHNANLYKISAVTDLLSPNNFQCTNLEGYKTIISQYRYTFRIYSDADPSAVAITAFHPVIGARRFQEISASPSVTYNNKITEAAVLGINPYNRWANYPYLTTRLTAAVPSAIWIGGSFGSLIPQTHNYPYSRINYPSTASGASEPCGGMLYWKSRLGGWMQWGMDLKKFTQSKKYTGKVPTGLFEAQGGNPYIQANYTGIETSYKYSLKALSLTSEELEAVQGIISSPAVYYMETPTSKLELFKLQSASAPNDSKTSGGDFSVQLQSISESSQMTR